jgi:hypothetical protein
MIGWFKRKPDPMTSRSRELHHEIAALESQIAQLSDASTLADPRQIQTVLQETRYLPPDPILRADEELTHSLPPITDPNCPGLFNNQGVRKFDLAGWWLRARRQPAPAPTGNDKLVAYLAAGRNYGYTALRSERRVARNRFILLAFVLLAMLWTVLSLLIPQL